MRSLAVRVSSVKNNDYTKKNLGELRILVLALPRTEIFNRTPDDAGKCQMFDEPDNFD